jgi:phenylacetate-CoA ligase
VAPGASGEIVVTHLATRDYPFIRYRTGDVGALGTQPCACGRGLPLIREIHGRTTDFVIAANGTVMHGLSVVYPIRELPGIAAFNVIQESIERTRVQIVPTGGYDSGIEHRICAGLKARLGERVQIAIETVASIPAEKSGKYRYVVSHAIGQQGTIDA